MIHFPEIGDIRVTCTDDGGNPVPDATVNLSMADGSASVTPPTATTDSNGNVNITVVSTNLSATDDDNTVTAAAAPPSTASASTPVTLTGVKLYGLTLVSGASAAASNYPNTGDNNWAALQNAATPATYAVFHVECHDGTALSSINWGGGQPVAGENNSYAQFPLTSSAEVPINPILAGAGLPNNNNLWIIWGSISTQNSGTPPAGAKPFPSKSNEQNQGGLGPTTIGTGSSMTGVDNYVAICKLTPSGVHSVVTSGFNMTRTRNSIFFFDGVESFDSNLTTFGPIDDTSDSQYVTTAPDASDQLYDDDGPNIGQGSAANSADTQSNFVESTNWNGAPCAAGYAFYYKAKWTNTSPYITQSISAGAPSLPTSAW